MLRSELRAFHVVARHSGFSRAAKAVNVSQPTLSAQVKALEQRYGVELFMRAGREVRLTLPGKELVEITARLMQAEQDAEIVPAIVDELADEHRVVLEAYYLGVMRGDVCRHWPHSARARVLGMARSTYLLRRSAARQQIAKNLVGRI